MEHNEKAPGTVDAYYVIDNWPQSASWQYSREASWEHHPSKRFIYNCCIYVSNGTKPGNVADCSEY